MADRNRKKRSRKNPYRTSMGMLLVTVVVLSFLCVMSIHMHTLQSIDRRYEVQENELSQEIQSEEKRSEELEESKAYVQTRQYVEQIAREKLGLVNPDETVVKPRG